MNGVFAMNETKEQAEQTTATIQKQIDDGTSKVGDIAEKAAHVVRDRTSMADDAAETLASKLDSASTYLHDADTDTLKNDVTSFIKKHPVMATAAGLVGGFLVLRMLKH
jgi:pyruvoyl-dependent arginine decarboxylase (PvlArgDC)